MKVLNVAKSYLIFLCIYAVNSTNIKELPIIIKHFITPRHFDVQMITLELHLKLTSLLGIDILNHQTYELCMF